MNVKQIWLELFKYWKVNEPKFIGCQSSNEQNFSLLKSKLNIDIPNELIESLYYYNDSSCLCFSGCFQLYDIKTIIDVYADGLEYGYVPNEKWIPIADWNGDIILFLSIEDGVIIYQDLEFGILKTIFESYIDFLNYIKNKILENGEFGYQDIQILI